MRTMAHNGSTGAFMLSLDVTLPLKASDSHSAMRSWQIDAVAPVLRVVWKKASIHVLGGCAQWNSNSASVCVCATGMTQ